VEKSFVADSIIITGGDSRTQKEYSDEFRELISGIVIGILLMLEAKV